MNSQNNQYESNLIADLNYLRRRQIIYKSLMCLSSLGVVVAIVLAILASTATINKLCGEIACIAIAISSLICIILVARYKFTWLPLMKTCKVKQYYRSQGWLIQSLIENMDGIISQNEKSVIGYKNLDLSTNVIGILNIDDTFNFEEYRSLLNEMHTCLKKKQSLSFVTILKCEKKQQISKLIHNGNLISEYPCNAQLICAYFKNCNKLLLCIPKYSKSKCEYYTELEKNIVELW